MDKILHADTYLSDRDLKFVVRALEAGELIIFPTETVYGLGAIANNDEALKKIYKAKGRPVDNPLILHVANKECFYRYSAQKDEILDMILDEFTPGPLTLIVKAKPDVSSVVTAGLDTVAIRIPSNTIAHQILKMCSYALAAPSANSSGKPSATVYKYAYDDLEPFIAYCVDGNDSEIGLESTILDMSVDSPIILRPGKISAEEINNFLSTKGINLKVKYNDEIMVAQGLSGEDLCTTTYNLETNDSFTCDNIDDRSVSITVPKAPGMKYRHYAPEATVYKLDSHNYSNDENVDNNFSDLEQVISNIIDSERLLSGDNVSILASSRLANFISNKFNQFNWSIYKCDGEYNAEFLAKNLYYAFRKLDEYKPKFILVEAISEDGIGKAVMNRLNKACHAKRK